MSGGDGIAAVLIPDAVENELRYSGRKRCFWGESRLGCMPWVAGWISTGLRGFFRIKGWDAELGEEEENHR